MTPEGEEMEVPSAEQQSYWREFVQLKAEACYIRDYRNQLGRRVTTVSAIRAIASTGGIAAWAVWKQYAYIWGCIIAASQVVDALKHAFPFYKQRAELSRWTKVLNLLFVEAQRDWEEISSGRHSNVEIQRMSHRLRSRKHRAETKYIPHGLTFRKAIFERAEVEAEAFFMARYATIEQES